MTYEQFVKRGVAQVHVYHGREFSLFLISQHGILHYTRVGKTRYRFTISTYRNRYMGIIQIPARYQTIETEREFL
jgi:hypothetical protein